MKYLSLIAIYSLFAAGTFAQPTSRASKAAESTSNDNACNGATNTNTNTNNNSPAANVATGAATTAAGNSSAGALVLPDGRIKQDAKPEDFNVLASVFKSAVVKGDGTSAPAL